MEPPKIIHTHSQLNVDHEHRKNQLILRLLIGGVLVLAIVAGFLWWSVQQAQSPRGFMASLEDKAGFTLYYPTQLPAGMTLDKNTISTTKEVVSTSYLYDNNKRLVVSMQPKAKGFDASTFNPTSEFTTSIGRAYVADLPNRTTAAVVSEQSWVLINAPERIAIDQLTIFINGLRPVK